MRTSGKNTFRGTMLVLLFGSVSVGMVNPALAQLDRSKIRPPTGIEVNTTSRIPKPDIWTTGQIIAVFADPQDFVVQFDKAGRCGSEYFNIRRSNANFKEMVALILTAFSTNKPLLFHVESCDSDRNIVSNGFVSK